MGITDKSIGTAMYSFGITSVRGMLTKLYREFDRCQNAKSREDLADSCINFAITSWHIFDWIWAAIARSPELKKEVAAICSVNERSLSRDDIIKYVIRSCPEIEWCQGICNGSKHVGGTSLLSTHVTETDDLITLTLNDYRRQDKVTNEIQKEYEAFIIHDGKKHNALEVFGRVREKWTSHLLEVRML